MRTDLRYYYWDIENAYTDEEIIERLRKGERVSFRESRDKAEIISIQFQELNLDGSPKDELIILKSWDKDMSEETIIKSFAPKLDWIERPWEFVPIGHNLYFDLYLYTKRAKIYGLEFDEFTLYHEQAIIDLKPICIGLNGFRFRGCGLDNFTRKRSSGVMIPVLYHDGKYEEIETYIKEEAEAVIEFFQNLKEALPEVRTNYGFISKD